MARTYAGGLIKKIYAGGMIKRVYAHYGPGQTDLVFSASNPVTYVVDTGVTYTEEVEYGASCLDPKSFTPAKSGWTFLGWREDTTAAASVLEEKAMDTEPVILYAVFHKIVTLSYNGNGATGGYTGTQSAIRYYNNGNSSNCTFQIQGNGFSRPGYTFVGWTTWSGGGVQYNPGGYIELGDNSTLYAVYIPNTITITISNSGIYPYVSTNGNGESGWKSSYGYISNCLLIHDSDNGYINRLIDVTHYRTMEISGQGGYYNCSGTLQFGVSPNTSSGSFSASSAIAYQDPGGTRVTGICDISGITGNVYIKFSNWKSKNCGVFYITLSV